MLVASYVVGIDGNVQEVKILTELTFSPW